MNAEAMPPKIECFPEDLTHLGIVSIMPDYFVDRFVRIDSLDDLISAIRAKSVIGGGSVRGVSQAEVKGGNAVNMAYALATLNVKVNLWAFAEGLAAEALKSTFKGFPNVDLEILKGKNGYTIALEFPHGDRIVNVMLSDVGDLRNFDGSGLLGWEKIAKSKIVAVLNWSSNREGTSLCERVFTFARESHVQRTFFDPADISEVSESLPEFKKRVLDQGLLDIISLNDNEARVICRSLCNFILPSDYSENDLKHAVKKLRDVSGAAIDLHTKHLSLTSSENTECVSVPCHRVNQLVVTGAGDVWDAANVLGYLAKWSDTKRLGFANAAAGVYVSRENARPPTYEETVALMNHL